MPHRQGRVPHRQEVGEQAECPIDKAECPIDKKWGNRPSAPSTKNIESEE
ncbi:MAG: hypothetical protein RBU37_24530 [Myxococcota bacterium]|nr:hypothetical protein [Myxococcota bacterium]